MLVDLDNPYILDDTGEELDQVVNMPNKSADLTAEQIAQFWTNLGGLDTEAVSGSQKAITSGAVAAIAAQAQQAFARVDMQIEEQGQNVESVAARQAQTEADVTQMAGQITSQGQSLSTLQTQLGQAQAAVQRIEGELDEKQDAPLVLTFSGAFAAAQLPAEQSVVLSASNLTATGMTFAQILEALANRPTVLLQAAQFGPVLLYPAGSGAAGEEWHGILLSAGSGSMAQAVRIDLRRTASGLVLYRTQTQTPWGIWKGSQADYNAIASKDAGVLYFVV